MSWFTKSRSAARKRRGVLTLEWTLLITVVIIGIIGGLGAVRGAILGELQDLAQAIKALNI
jgi:Flp pilus assembly pilin Flp